MNKILFSFFLILSLTSCTKESMQAPSTDVSDQVSNHHPKADSLQRILSKYTKAGIPGAVITLLDKNGYWASAAGYAKLEDRSPMKSTHLQYGFSITKIFTAVAVLQLYEKGLVDLEKPIEAYLPAHLRKLVPQTGKVTVRMLLNHSSGYNDYVRTNEFQLRFLDNPLHVWTREEYYDLIERKVNNEFTPGSDFKYSNTNFYLLSLLIDEVTGHSHSDWIQKQIFEKLNLKETYYKHSSNYPFYKNLPNVYWPRFDNGQLENISRAQQAWMQSEEYGATGIIATPKDYISFLKALNEGKLLTPTTLSLMRTWIQGKQSTEPDYGLGLMYWGYKGKEQYGHDGDGIGAAANLMYFPASDTYVFFAVNSTTELGGDLFNKIYGFRNEIGNYLAGF